MRSEWKPETLGQYHDIWATVLLWAPDQFRDIGGNALLPDQNEALRSEFNRLRDGFHFARKHLKDDRLSRIAEELLSMSLEAYLRGDPKTGAHTLQECEGLIWPSRQTSIKYGVEAERRAFGNNVLYAGVVASPYPFEGNSSDLGRYQAQLLCLAEQWCRSYQQQGKEFQYFSWIIDHSDETRRISLLPKEDRHSILKPVQRSRGYKRLKELGGAGAIRACVLMEIIGPLGDGLVSFHLEEVGCPRVSARQLFRRKNGGIYYEPLRYHLEEPDIIVRHAVA